MTFDTSGGVVRLEELEPGISVDGVVPGEAVMVVAITWYHQDAMALTYRRTSGVLDQGVLYRSNEPSLALAAEGQRPFDVDGGQFKLAAEAQRIQLAGLFDPMLAVATSEVEPLPHQIRAVYGELLPRTPLRFLLADDPGAGKTIMAGLYIKELLLRGDVQRCLVVAPGGLVEQWQDELWFKFGMRFDILTPQHSDSNIGSTAFEQRPFLIARMDQLARNGQLLEQLKESEWDLIVVDEAHRMGARYFGGKLEKTKRFHLGESLGQRTRHYLLMTATPHSGKEQDFQLLLSLLDRDRYVGKFRPGVHNRDTTGVMRRMVKEDLLTFEGKPLFPERYAQTVPYELTEQESDLYEQVTRYVRDGMNRADQLDSQRRNTVGFALTVLQRRLASSPEAIHRSLQRRVERLERRQRALEEGRADSAPEPSLDQTVLTDPDESTTEELERVEEELLDAATAARTLEELGHELTELRRLVALAKRVRDSGRDRKWSELSSILEENVLRRDAEGRPRKLIIFTEHRDTVDYLMGRIRNMLGRPDAVRAIHGGIRRADRWEVTEEFTKNPECRVLLATDAAGEGLNLQVAHLMVNYDLPWNPNRIEQRFGRIHRIGQVEVCRLWNLVASNTREGQVFQRLLTKVEEQRKAYGGKVFDVLGASFDEHPLRDLLIEAIREGERPEVRARMHQTIDQRVADGLTDMLQERALASDSLAAADLESLRRQMDEARTRRLQPHYIEWAFRNAFTHLGGRMAMRESGRFEIRNVPAAVRNASRWVPVSTRYERVTFDVDRTEVDGASTADLLAPGHPLHDAVLRKTTEQLAGVLERGTVLVSAAVDAPTLLVGVIEDVVDGSGATVAKRFGYAFVDEDGGVAPAGPAPYLDCVAAPDSVAAREARALPWLNDAETKAVGWIVAEQLPAYLEEVRARRGAEILRVREQVVQRLNEEINRLTLEETEAREKERAGEKPRESPESLARKAAELDDRLHTRTSELDQQLQMSPKPPRIVTAALLIPLSAVQDELPEDTPIHAVATKEVERRAVDLVLTRERQLGRRPVEQAFNNPGFDILSEVPDGDPLRIEVKGGIAGKHDFFVTHNEVITGKNAVPRYRLAMVRVDPHGPEHDDVRYLQDPFRTVELGDDLDITGIRAHWDATWDKGTEPF